MIQYCAQNPLYLLKLLISIQTFITTPLNWIMISNSEPIFFAYNPSDPEGVVAGRLVVKDALRSSGELSNHYQGRLRLGQHRHSVPSMAFPSVHLLQEWPICRLATHLKHLQQVHYPFSFGNSFNRHIIYAHIIHEGRGDVQFMNAFKLLLVFCIHNLKARRPISTHLFAGMVS